MKVTKIAQDSFAHGNRKYEPGDTVEVTKGEADELTAAGLVGDEAKEQTPQPGEAPAETPADDDVDDLLGQGVKQDAEPVENKMEAAPANKASSKAKTTKKED